MIAQLDQGGIGLPDRDYYLKDDPKSVELRQKYMVHVQRMFELAAIDPGDARRFAGIVMRMETALAKGSLDRVSRRDPEKVYHLMKRGDLSALGSGFVWAQYFTGLKPPAFQTNRAADKCERRIGQRPYCERESRRGLCNCEATRRRPGYKSSELC